MTEEKRENVYTEEFKKALTENFLLSDVTAQGFIRKWKADTTEVAYLTRVFNNLTAANPSKAELDALLTAREQGIPAFAQEMCRQIKPALDYMLNTEGNQNIVLRSLNTTQNELAPNARDSLAQGVMAHYIQAVTHTIENSSDYAKGLHIDLSEEFGYLTPYLQTVDDFKHTAFPTEKAQGPIINNLHAIEQSLKISRYNKVSSAISDFSTTLYNKISELYQLQTTYPDLIPSKYIEQLNNLADLLAADITPQNMHETVPTLIAEITENQAILNASMKELEPKLPKKHPVQTLIKAVSTLISNFLGDLGFFTQKTRMKQAKQETKSLLESTMEPLQNLKVELEPLTTSKSIAAPTIQEAMKSELEAGRKSPTGVEQQVGSEFDNERPEQEPDDSERPRPT